MDYSCRIQEDNRDDKDLLKRVLVQWWPSLLLT